MWDIKQDQYSVGKVRGDAEEHLSKRALELAVPTPEPEPPNPFEQVPKAPSSDDRTFLYLIAIGDLVKIGYAANLYVRLSNLRVDNPHDAQLAHYREIPKIIVKDLERFVHMALEKSHHRGEWFTVSVDDALTHVERVQAIVSELYGLSNVPPAPSLTA